MGITLAERNQTKMSNQTVAIFILVNGAWQMHGAPMIAGANASYIKSEMAYLVDTLGVTARLFRRES